MEHFLVPESGKNKTTMTFLAKISMTKFKITQIQKNYVKKREITLSILAMQYIPVVGVTGSKRSLL